MDEKPHEVINLIERDNFNVLECTIMSMLDMDKDNELLVKDFHFWNGECVFSEVSILYHWDGDIVGCCMDNTKSQVYGNVRDGIYSDKVEARRKKLRQDLIDDIYDELPACARCEGKIKCKK
jgi:hypothetical protein